MTPELTSSACSRCETLPAVPAAAGILYLRFPLQHSLGKVLVWLARNSPPWERKGATVCISVGDREELAGILRGINTVLSSQEQQDARAVYHPEGYQARPEDFFDAQPLQGFQAQVNSGWLLELLKERRLTSWFQPIVEVQAPDRMLGHECLLRGQTAEGVIGAGPILTAARQAGLLFQLDLAARRSALECAAREQAPGLIFINFSPAAIYDPQYCLRSTLATLDELGLDRSRCVFEVTETDHVADREHLQSILDFYRKCGFLVALDDLGSGYSSLLRLHELRPDFVKLDSSLIQGADRDPLKSVLAAKLLEAARGMGIRSVAEGVETPGELAWLQQHEADYVQGFLIARPAPHPWTGAGTATQSSR